MHRRLADIDPDEAQAIHPNNAVRIIRALEIFYLTGKSKTELAATGSYKKCDYEFKHHCLAPPREELYARINGRVDRMMAQGLLPEVEGLVAEGRAAQLRRANVIGYMELLDFLEGTRSLDEAISLIKQNSRRYAKRQMTWFRHQTNAQMHADAESLLRAIRH
jgi:tRNA dimethylallyltransferase